MKLSTIHLSSVSYIDLHMHTIYSDGTWTPEQLLEHLSAEQFSLAAISDHDRTEMVASIQQLAQERNLPVLTAVEMTTTWKGELVDMLCYGFDPEQNTICALAQDVYHRQQENTRAVFETLTRQGYVFPAGALERLVALPVPCQPHAFSALLKEQGYGSAERSTGRILLDAGCAFATSEPAAVVEAAHQSGAVCILAHPGRDDGFVQFNSALLDEFRRIAPVDGLEVYYPVHTPAQKAMYLEYADQNHLLVSSGSDSHGPEKPPIKYPAELSRALLERLGIRVD